MVFLASPGKQSKRGGCGAAPCVVIRLRAAAAGRTRPARPTARRRRRRRSEEHTSELQSLMRISYAVFCLKKKKAQHNQRQQLSDQLTDAHNTEKSEPHTTKLTTMTIT